MKKKIGILLVLALWGTLTMGAWLRTPDQMSESERRPLAQAPAVEMESVVSGDFMEDFEKYSLDQFPLRGGFRRLKSLFHFYGMGQLDNNGIYLAQGHAAKQEYPLNQKSLNHVTERLQHLYDKYLAEYNERFADSRVFLAIVPDKGYYLAAESGHLAMDYETLFARMTEELPWAQPIDLTDTLSLDDYYRTDTHWRQEDILDAAGAIAQALGVTEPKPEDFTQRLVERPFYGVYYGQAALPMEPDRMILLENELLANCTVYDHESGTTGSIYNEGNLAGRDMYEVFLSGPRSLLTVENPAAATDRELIVFRDSFGSSMIPLLLQDYARVTVVDIRYVRIDMLERFVEFKGQDVLLLYSTLILNQSDMIQ